MAIEILNDDVAFGLESGTLFNAVEIPGYGKSAKGSIEPPPQPYSSFSEWATWGSDNMQPVRMADHIEHCGVLSAAIDAKSRIAVGKGIEPFFKVGVNEDGSDILEWCGEPEIHDWIDANNLFDYFYDSSFDEHAYGWSAGRFLYNTQGTKINCIERIDVYDARVSMPTLQTPYSNALYLCADWRTAPAGFDKTKHIKLPLLKQGYEIDQIQELNAKEVAFATRRRRNGRSNYPTPLWFANEEWVKVARSVPEYKNALFQNQISIKYVVTIHPEYWAKHIPNWNDLKPDKQAAAKKTFYDKIDQWLSGKSNTGKSLFNGGFFEKATGNFVPYITVETIDDKFKEGKLLPDSAAANSEILFALMINPALMGAGQPGGAYSNNAGGSNVRESYLTQIMLLDASRKQHARMLHVVKYVNGWKKYEAPNKRLVFRFQSGLLTTLDTGKSTKNEPVG